MDTFLPKRIDETLRRHPLVASVCMLALGVIVCWIMIGAGQSILVYEGF